MDKKWTALVPQRQYVVSAKTGKPLLTRQPRLIGSLPEDAYLLIYVHLPLCDAVNLARSCRKVAALANDDRVWRRKLSLLDYKGPASKEAERILEGIAKKASEKEELELARSGSGNLRASLDRNGKQTSIDLTRSSALARRNSITAAAAAAAAKANTSSASSAAAFSSSSSSSNGKRSSVLLQPSTVSKTPTIPERSTLGPSSDDDALFGDFVDFANASKSPNTIDTSHFASISLDDPFADGSSARAIDPARPAPSAKRKEEDLLMLFDDEEDMGLATASPAKPPLSALSRSQSISRSQPGPNGKTPSPSGSSARQSVSLARNGSVSTGTHYSSPAPYRDLFVAYYTTLLPYFTSLKSFTTSSLIFTSPHLTPLTRAQLFSTISRLCQHTSLQPTSTRNSASLQLVRRNLQSSIDHFEASMLSNFEKAADGNLLAGMKDAAQALWELNGGGSVVQVFFNKIPLFYDQSWDPMRNLTKQIGPMGEPVDGIDFAAMDSFMNHVLAIVAREGRTIAKIFPQDSDVLVQFADRIANDVISDYIVPLLEGAQDLPNPLFLLTTAATFGQCSRLIDTVLAIEPRSSAVTHTSVSAVVFEMFEPHMASYLAQEGEWTREYLIGICTEWDTKIAAQNAARDGADPTFLTAQNPQMVKRNVLAQFGKALLLPVTIVPKTVVFGVNALTAGGTMAFNAMSGGFVGAQSQKALASTTESGTPASRPDRARMTSTTSLPSSPPMSLASSSGTAPIDFSGFQMLLSIETAMQLVQADRDCLKRVQTFEGYTGKMGMKVKSAIEEVFIVLCQTLAESHLQPAFGKATDLMGSYKPAEHASDDSLAPLVQFFELVHIGDTIAQMVQVYYDRELSKYVDKNDFLSPVVREKKRFENALDESVASGLNAGLQILMTQAEYILSTRQDPRDFSPELFAGDDGSGSGGAAGSRKGSMTMLVDIEGPTKAAEAVVDCLRSHCDMLKGSTDKAILEVFHQEVGLRLHGMLLKHLKRSIVSISGGFQVIADLNVYTSFISSMRLPNVQPYFTALKMAANVFIIDSAKDLGSMARDLDRYEGTLRIEDIMELVRCRTDWKKIEREVEKEVFGFKAEDCSIQ